MDFLAPSAPSRQTRRLSLPPWLWPLEVTAQARAPYAERFRSRWGEQPGPIEAAGYDAGLVTSLAMANPRETDPAA